MTTEEPIRPGHDTRTLEERLSLVERDVRSHARSLTALVKTGTTFSIEQMEQLRGLLREEFGNVGLRIDEDEHVDSAREDFRFLRRTRLKWDSAANRVGSIVLAAIVGLVLIIGGMGFWAWLSKGLGH
jgi:hypothetical protein